MTILRSIPTPPPKKKSSIKILPRNQFYTIRRVPMNLSYHDDNRLTDYSPLLEEENRMCRSTPLPFSRSFTIRRNSQNRALLDKSNVHHLSKSTSSTIQNVHAGDNHGNNDNSNNKSNKKEIEFDSCGSFSKELKQRQINRRRVVQFSPEVTVVAIQSHRDYSQSTRKRVWSSRREIMKNARRNYIEFRADGRDWRRAVEEEGMWTDIASGELVHPVHIPRHVVQWHRQQAMNYYFQYQHPYYCSGEPIPYRPENA